ncbi:undecaprenyl/decaprenyl-phosphate alpha-N-acetylglucosaminyl 1-phosphate transferase [Lentibacillus cibarius]|uniref:Undecaprenyl/decaprenyl-phosphate alpha-N-acetylglucosaminyl 1-phosphate transferase n=1 Tax=Lentibacillus cibarius TaxID=2583219 RepID=A0A549YFR6_9BACI|nr:MraY family glycosyltransferase [Lentibacillus cibarius]TMN21951.1 undecaprenyl/decaprenyl-phosphate alpha-N-acetylglucosaminyl 1-phosphate transferase [Lentibacillus cibarius]TRM10715.1 undecaprenyl/decaprenyl-phosphate alpha-N-acetylglucosaminyl 1-phosphate transferase [Lentibacillus cibarius]
MVYAALSVCIIVSLFITPLVKKLAIRIGAVDQPNDRKVHQKIMPRLGGLAIFFSFLLGFLLFLPETMNAWPVLAGAIIITGVGVLDDLYELSAKAKFGGQLVAAIITVLGGVQIDFVTLPFGIFGDRIDFGLFAIPITILWIVGITNAINLIDGLDGLAAGVSAIVLLTISGLGIAMGNPLVALLGFLLLGSTLGFLAYNFHPAKIFMGDTGALFLGYMISVLAVMGLFKNVAIFSLIVPIMILGVPILDTLFAIIRRFLHKKPLSAPDKLHLHHCLLRLGFSHRQTVIMIYALSGIFSTAAIVFTEATIWGSTLILFGLIILVELVVEVTGLISENYRPLLKLMNVTKKRL